MVCISVRTASQCPCILHSMKQHKIWPGMTPLHQRLCEGGGCTQSDQVCFHTLWRFQVEWAWRILWHMAILDPLQVMAGLLCTLPTHQVSHMPRQCQLQLHCSLQDGTQAYIFTYCSSAKHTKLLLVFCFVLLYENMMSAACHCSLSLQLCCTSVTAYGAACHVSPHCQLMRPCKTTVLCSDGGSGIYRGSATPWG